MGSDRARISYDPSRHWRGVVSQQGRVTLEADWNEAATIAAARNEAELIDVIGPAGTPDNGYFVSAVTGSGGYTGDLAIQQGTLYVGGERIVLDADLLYSDQPDWLDNANDSLWVPVAVPDGDEAVYLLLREQEVGAVEDPALLDVALGGPDTSGRLRIIQRVVRQSAPNQTTCWGALEDLEQAWEALGLQFDPTTMRLNSATSLRVSFQQEQGTATPCQPVAQGGYLGAENQLIRVQVASVTNDVPTLVWGFDNAYFLYPITTGPGPTAGTTTITLASQPVDVYHQPQAFQAVEVLQAAAELTWGETSSDYIAATTGTVTTVTADGAYQETTQQLVISTPTPLPASTQLFLRVWQGTAAYTGGNFPLGDTGVQVTLGSSSNVYHVGDYWVFAVRPGTPTSVSPVYPERILDAAQPPDGPRLWACQLAVIAWEDGTPTVVPCVPQFENLVTLSGDTGGCCTVDVSPGDVDGGATLQALIDRYANQGATTICLQSGTYTLPAPLRISDYSNLTIQACDGDVVLTAAEGPPESFLLGLILLDDPTDFTLRGIELSIPLVPLPDHQGTQDRFTGMVLERQPLLNAYTSDLAISIGVHVADGSGVSIENCTFSFAASSDGNVLGAGVYALGSVTALKVLDCSFSTQEVQRVFFSELARGAEADPPYQVRFGYLHVAGALASGKGGEGATRTVLPSLADAAIERNLFDGLTVPALVIGRLGTIRVEDNTVRSCYGGFWLIAAETIDVVTMLDRAEAGDQAAYGYIASSQLTAVSDPVLMFATAIARILPPTPPSSGSPGGLIAIKAPSTASLTAAQGLFQRLYVLSPATGSAGTDAASAKATAQEATTQPPVPDTTEPAPADAAQPPPADAAEPAPADAAEPAERAVQALLPTEISEIFTSTTEADESDQVPAADPGTGLIPRLDVRTNQVDAVISDSYTGAALLVIALDSSEACSLICIGNRLRSRVVDGATVSLLGIVECACTGNVVTNEIAESKTNTSLVLRPLTVRDVAEVAVTGNVLIGPVSLPDRPASVPAPLNQWIWFNTVVPVYVNP